MVYRFFALCCLSYLLACSDEEKLTLDPSRCGSPIQIVDVLLVVEVDSFALIDASVTDRCLSVTVGASGCGSEGWNMDLITLGQVAESNPTQTSAELVFDDGVPAGQPICAAFIEETYEFDLSPYLTDGALPTIFTLGTPRGSRTFAVD
jgi:hypothetical protein